MFDIGFSEIAVIGVVALVVLGPERLPKVARTAGHLFGRLQRYVNGVKADIAREMEASELAKIKQEVQDAARSFEQTVQEQSATIESEARALKLEAEKSMAEKSLTEKTEDAAAKEIVAATPTIAPPPTPTQAEILAAEDAAFAKMAAPTQAGTQLGLDFGIEPLRKMQGRQS